MSKKFSELLPKDSLDSADYIPIVDSADSDPETQNKIVTFQTVRGYFTEDLDEFLATAQAQESARVSAENTRRSNETTRQSHETTRQSNEATREANEATRQANEATREDAETGYIQQAKSWAVGTNGVARQGDATDNAKYYAEQAGASATSASASATNASASETSAATSAQSAQASATQAAISAESVDAPALTKKILAAFPQESLNGQLLTLTDGADGIPAKKLTLNLSPHQSGSGDPSPENVRSISGYTAVKVTRAGKNVLPNQLEDATIGGNTYVKNADGSVTVSGTVGNQSNVRQIINSLPIAKGDYILSGGTEHARIRINKYNLNGELVNRIHNGGGDTPFTVDDTIGRIYVGVNPYPTGETIDNVTVYPMIRAASFADDTYEPYTAQEYDITIPTSAGTVYGGQLTVDQDGSGTLVVDRGMVALDSLNWASYTGDSTGHSFYAATPTDAKGVVTNADLADAQCSIYSIQAFQSKMLWVRKDNALCQICSPQRYVARDTRFSDVSDFIAAISGQTLVYEFEEPQTYTLTAEEVTTLLGSNTLFMSADGSIDLTYRADTTLYISSLITGIRNNIAYIEDGMTASRAYTVGQFVLIGGQLYKVTASIASGATFTIGTNVTATTVGTELTALA